MNKVILVVDDTIHILNNLRESLEMEGYDVVTATNGIEALEWVKTGAVDLVITDLVMPQMDGFTFIHKLKMQPRTKNIPVIIFSAKPLEEEGKQIADLGAACFVLKPSSTETILDAVAALLRK